MKIALIDTQGKRTIIKISSDKTAALLLQHQTIALEGNLYQFHGTGSHMPCPEYKQVNARGALYLRDSDYTTTEPES